MSRSTNWENKSSNCLWRSRRKYCEASSESITFETKHITIICDDTVVFVLLIHYYVEYNLTCNVVMFGTSHDRKTVNIAARKDIDIVSHLLAAHVLSGGDKMAQMFGIGKAKVIAWRTPLASSRTILNSPVAEGLSLAMSGNNHFFAFFNTLHQVVCESVGCTKIHGLAFSKFKMAAKMAAKSWSTMIFQQIKLGTFVIPHFV